MRTSEERIEELHRRAAALRRAKLRRRNRLAGGAAVCVCLALSILFAAVVAHAPAPADEVMPAAAAASIFPKHAALGFVVVAIVAFCLGALVTALCAQLKKNEKNGETSDAGRH